LAKQPETKVKFSIFNKEFNQGIAEISKESTKLRKEFKLQEEQLKANGKETEKYEAKISHLSQQQELVEKKVKATADQLAKAKSIYGENSEEARKLTNKLLDYQIAQKKVENQLSSTRSEQMRYKKSIQDVERLLEVTETSAEDFANTIGPELSEAIVKGTASTKQLEFAFRKLSSSALGSEADFQKVKKSLSTLDDGASIKAVRKDLDKLTKDADEARGAVRDLGSELGGIVGGVAAGVGIGAAINQSLDSSTLKAKIDLNFEVPESAKKEIYELVRNVETYGIDAETALEGVRRQWALNKNQSDEANASVIEGAVTITELYAGLDFNELIQETNEIASALKISNKEALGLVDSLLQGGFPPEQLDIIAEYGTQLSLAGYTAEEIQNIFAAGVDTKSWNIDNLLDGLKEGRIGLAEFGLEVPEALKEVLSQTEISESQVRKWGKAVADGGEKGKTAMFEAAKALSKVEDGTLRNELGVQMFGTMWEDQGQKIVDTLLNAEKGTANLSQQQENLNEKTKQIKDTPMKQLASAFQELKVALDPLFVVIANVVSTIASWAKDNPVLVSTIVAIISVIGVLVGIIVALAPIFAAIATIAKVVGVSIGALAGPIAIVIAAIAALIAIGVAVWKNWDQIKIFAAVMWTAIKFVISTAVQAIKTAISIGFNFIKSIALTIFNGLKLYFQTTWNLYKLIFTTAISLIRNAIVTGWNAIKIITSNVFNSIRVFISSIWNGIRNIVISVINSIRSTISSVFNAIRSTIMSVFGSIKSTAVSIWNGIRNAIVNPIQSAKEKVLGIIDRIKNAFTSMKITIPKPKLPSVDISKGIKTIAGIDIPYPKFNVTWHKTGGVFTKPVIAGNAGFGDVEEGIVPFEGPHAMRIAKLIADAQNKIQGAYNLADKAINNIINVLIEPADIIMDNRSVGKATWRVVREEWKREEGR
jgi:phage-related minor tail protein